MYKENKIIAIIPARGGSKGLTRKNIRPLSGRPLIAWTISQAKSSKYIDRVIVSTEDREISDIARDYGADTPFVRPKRLAADNAKGIDVMLHAIDQIENADGPYDISVLLQPTSPLRRVEDIDRAIRALFAKNADGVISVCTVKEHPCRVNRLPVDGCMKNFLKPAFRNKNRQELSVFYKINGAVYVFKNSYIKRAKSFFGKKTFAYVMPPERSMDIDDEIDLEFAEFMLLKGRIS